MDNPHENDSVSRHGLERIDAWLDPDVIDALDHLAQREETSRSALIRRAVRESLQTKGWSPKGRRDEAVREDHGRPPADRLRFTGGA